MFLSDAAISLAETPRAKKIVGRLVDLDCLIIFYRKPRKQVN